MFYYFCKEDKCQSVFENLIRHLAPGGSICIQQGKWSSMGEVNHIVQLISALPYLPNMDVSDELLNAETLHWIFTPIIQKYAVQSVLNNCDVSFHQCGVEFIYLYIFFLFHLIILVTYFFGRTRKKLVNGFKYTKVLITMYYVYVQSIYIFSLLMHKDLNAMSDKNKGELKSWILKTIPSRNGEYLMYVPQAVLLYSK